MDTEALSTLLRELMPVGAGYRELNFVDAAQTEQGDVRATVQLIQWEPRAEAGRAIRDIKEQAVVLVPAAFQADDRIEAYVRGWSIAVAEVLAGTLSLEALMPHDLVHPDVLSLRSLQTEAEFAQSLWQRSRLGHLVPGLAPRAGPGIRRSPPTALSGAASAAWLHSALADLLPLKKRGFVLQAAGPDPVMETPEGLQVELELRTPLGTQLSARVLLVKAAGLPDARRVRSYLCAWVEAVERLFSGSRWEFHDGRGEQISWELAVSTPSELTAPDVLDEPDLEHPEEFLPALLSSGRLGRWMS